MTLLDRSGPAVTLPRGRRERRRLVRLDRLAALRALLTRTAQAIDVADAVVAGGWLQEHWFTWRGDDGRERTAGSSTAHTVPLDAVTGACLVGALVVGGRGVASPVLRSEVEATWHALRRDRGPVDWVRSPAVAELHVRELTSWNDRPGRSVDQVRALLADGRDLVQRELAVTGERLAVLL